MNFTLMIVGRPTRAEPNSVCHSKWGVRIRLVRKIMFLVIKL